jgi:Zn-dependent protease
VAYVGVLLNVVLAVFNLLPFFPLDGSAVLMGVAPGRWVPALSRLQLLGPVLLVGVILLDVVFDLGLLWGVMGPVVNWITKLFIG